MAEASAQADLRHQLRLLSLLFINSRLHRHISI
jgi:hypothetical protein